VAYAMDAVELKVTHDDSSVFTYTLPVRVATPENHNRNHPSILGTDFLLHFRLVVDYGLDVVELH